MRRQAIVVAVDTATSTCTIQLAGDDTVNLASIAYLASYTPSVNDVVWVDQLATDLLVVGAQVPASSLPHGIVRGTFSGTTDATGHLAGIAHGAPFTPSAVALIKTNVLGNPNWWQYGTDSYTSTTFRARFLDGVGTILNAQSVAGTFIAYGP